MGLIRKAIVNYNHIYGCHPQLGIAREDLSNSNILTRSARSPRHLPPDPRRVQLKRLFGKINSLHLPGALFAQQYLRHQYRRNLKGNTLRNTATGIILFLQLLKQMGHNHIETVSRVDVEAFIEHEQDRGLNVTTVQNRLATVKSFIRYLVRKGVLKAPLKLKELNLKLPQTLPRAMDPHDVFRLLDAVDDVRNRAMILVLLRTGMRIGELLDCKATDICLADKKIFIYEGEKNRLGRSVCLSQDACQALSQWLCQRDDRREYLFYSKYRPTLSYPTARNIFCSYLKKAGLSEKGYTPHCLRHTFATELLNAGMPIECLQQLLGHSSLEITQRYARLTDRTREEEYFKAMSKIEKEHIDGSHRFDHPLQEIFEKEELLGQHTEKLFEPSEAVHCLAEPTGSRRHEKHRRGLYRPSVGQKAYSQNDQLPSDDHSQFL